LEKALPLQRSPLSEPMNYPLHKDPKAFDDAQSMRRKQRDSHKFERAQELAVGRFVLLQ